jgi:hypothetical protein
LYLIALAPLIFAAAVLRAPAPARAGFGDLVDAVRDRLDSVLIAYDVLAAPATEVELRASLRTGLRLEGIEGKRLQFLRGEELLGEVKTDEDGNAAIPWTVPDEPGDYLFTVRAHPDDQPKRPAPDAELLVAARKADAKLLVTDLDKTVVASGFFRVLTGGAEPMPGAAAVLERLAPDHTVIYLTHRPDVLGPTSKRWLAENGFPRGPLLASTLSGFLGGSGRYKTDRLNALHTEFKNIVAGIGDKLSDARAYADNGVASILILDVDWSEDEPEDYDRLADDLAALPDAVQVVTNWTQIADVLLKGAHFPKADMEKRLRDTASDLRRRPTD